MELPVTCPVCQIGEGFRVVERCGDYVLYHCPDCDLVFSRPMKSGDSAWYDERYFVRHVAIDDRIMWYFTWALKNLPEKGKLLDVGCGAGTFVACARKEGFDAYGIDFSRDAVEAGKRRFGLETIFASPLEEFRRRRSDELFDAVTFFEVLEHVESPTRFLAEIHALLKPGGWIALSVPNRDRWPVRDFMDYPPNHLTRWTTRSLQRLLEASGFTVLKIERAPVALSINFFFGYLFRILLYRMLNLYSRGLSGSKRLALPRGQAPPTWVGGIGSKIRKFRDAVMWVPTVVLLPVLYPFFDGYNIVALAKKGSGEG